ncbi:TMhelix containing protein [Vibrio phage 1.214.O._10N.222.54.F11]|nr:coil containing protein [Vibrio phage 1.013.O._10N.286.54.F9]AUR89349.1 TMhelix containing protein [Vibrio phage 1.122.A._10N.286.46.F8]AUR89418.1 TMhelix containing protein [Vibrio phage 1.122.B._10N.286.46.F8]AUR95909.1 TMhelix containing protein [Vibrio phage 1.214.O._10N.222.54.F11]
MGNPRDIEMDDLKSKVDKMEVTVEVLEKSTVSVLDSNNKLSSDLSELVTIMRVREERDKHSEKEMTAMSERQDKTDEVIVKVVKATEKNTLFVKVALAIVTAFTLAIASGLGRYIVDMIAKG